MRSLPEWQTKIIDILQHGTGMISGAVYDLEETHMTTEEIYKNLEAITVGIDDTFKFLCTQCGKCCINRTDIMLSPMDVFRMTKELQISPSDFFAMYCRMEIGIDSRMPIVMLRPVGKDYRCPLLQNNKCSVHKVKPAVCGMFPLGRYVSIDPEKYSKGEIETSEVKYLLQPPECGDESETHTVREWLGDFDIALEDEAYVRWNQVMGDLSLRLQELQKKWDMMTMMDIWFVVHVILFENYEHDMDFMPQFEFNVTGLKSLLMDIPKLKEMVNRGRRA